MENISAEIIRLNQKALNGNSSFERANAAVEEIITVPTTTHRLTKTLLNTYLKNGTVELPKDITRSRKFLPVGCLTKNVGGKRNNSSSGLNAAFTM
ncbi:MAG: hypothetical protein ACLR56_02795 [Oscillospiraceae bacterium]